MTLFSHILLTVLIITAGIGNAFAQTADKHLSRTAKKLHEFYENLDYDKALDFAKNKNLDAESAFVLALCHSELERAEDALRLMDEVLKKEPANTEYRFFASAVYTRFGESKKALSCINEVLKHEKKGTSYLTKAEILLDLSREKEALQVLDSAIVFPHTEVTGLILKASVFAEREDHKTALLILEKLLTRKDLEAEDFYTARYNAALSYFFSENYHEAYARFEALYRENPEDFEALSRLIQICNRQENYQKANSLKALMYKAFQEQKIPESMQGMFCIDHYDYNGKKVVVMERFAKAFGLGYKHIFYLLDKQDNPILSVQTEHNFTLEQMGKTYALGQTRQSGEHFIYFQFSYKGNPPYAQLKADVAKVLSGKAKPSDATRYSTEEEVERAAGKQK